jgi:hypothetical protein
LNDVLITPRTHKPLLSIVCPSCRCLLRLVQIVPDDKRTGVEVRTYACECGTEAWQTVEH